MTHSPEPWAKGEGHESSAQLVDATGKRIADVRAGYGIRLPCDAIQEPDANIDRIVACVNACAGIPTEALQNVARVFAAQRVADRMRPHIADATLTPEMIAHYVELSLGVKVTVSEIHE